jgi:anaerobic carbon-monoxide dehydrogenase iron sulfur subunit
MANTPVEQKKAEGTPQDPARRDLFVKAGVGVAGAVVGGAVIGVIPRRAPASPPVPDTWIGRNISSCTGCRLCEVACSLIKEQKIQPGIARISVRQYYPGVEFPVACYQCGAEAKCAEACPVSALTVDTSKKLNTISVDTSRCLRTNGSNGDCMLCNDKCPGTVVNFHPTTRAPLFCDLCGGDPACVKVCPSSTIMVKGVKMAAIQPTQIAAGLAAAFKVPEGASTVPSLTAPAPRVPRTHRRASGSVDNASI